MNTLSRTLDYDSDKISQAFFDALVDVNYHSEAYILEGIWHAMANVDYVDSSDRYKLKKAAIESLLKMDI
jgi:hypothetical protein